MRGSLPLPDAGAGRRGKVCERGEQPVEGLAHALRYNPAGLPTPSPIQGHATVLVAIVAAVVLLCLGAWFVFRGVGPFRAEVVRQQVSVTARPSRSSCGYSTTATRQAGPGAASPGWARTGGCGTRRKLSPTVPGDGSVAFVLRGEGPGTPMTSPRLCLTCR